MSLLESHPGVVVIALALALMVAAALLRRAVYLVSLLLLVVGIGFLFPGPRDLVGTAAQQQPVGAKLSCLVSGLGATEVLLSEVTADTLDKCSNASPSPDPADQTSPPAR